MTAASYLRKPWRMPVPAPRVLPSGHFFAGLRRHHYRCAAIDPPTKFVGGTKGRPQHYGRVTDRWIAAMPILDIMHPDGFWLFYWVTSSKLYRAAGSKAILRPDEIAAGWRCRFSARAFLWVKRTRSDSGYHTGLGLTTLKNTEDCLLFRKGHPARRRGVKELIVSPVREHSRKPDETYERIERYCDGPYVELFARETMRPNWDLWGNEVGKFAQVAA